MVCVCVRERPCPANLFPSPPPPLLPMPGIELRTSHILGNCSSSALVLVQDCFFRIFTRCLRLVGLLFSVSVSFLSSSHTKLGYWDSAIMTFSSSFLFVFCSRIPLYSPTGLNHSNLPAYAFLIAGTKGMHHHAQLMASF